jgi:hypothetical protein
MPDEPLAQLPDHITLDLSEAGDVLGALDEAVELAEPGTEVHREILRVTRLITRKLWPELGDLLDDDDR